MDAEKIRKIQIYTSIGVFYSKFSEFESAVEWLTSTLTKVPIHTVTILQTESPTFARIKCLKKIIETNSVSDEDEAAIRRILNKFSSDIIPFRNKLAHATFYLSGDGLNIGSTDDAYLEIFGRKAQPKIIENLPDKINECIELTSQLISITSQIFASQTK